jgi:DNA-binding NtrC family response regulator
MDPKNILKGKYVLIVDDEKDILDILVELLSMCKIDTALTFEEAKKFLENNYYDIAVLDIMGVKGYDLLAIANEKKVPALMLTAHALSKESLKKSFQEGASYFVPKDEINKIDTFVADVIDAREKKKNVFVKWYERLGSFCDNRFGPNWKEEDSEFWKNLISY